MSWRKPTVDDIVATISQEELDAYCKSRAWSSDPVETLCNRVASFVRGYLTTNGNIRLSPNEHEIPEATIGPAMDYLAVDILKRMGVEPTQVRQSCRTEAIAYLRDIASGKLTVESYGSGDARTTGGPAVEIVSTSRNRCEDVEGF